MHPEVRAQNLSKILGKEHEKLAAGRVLVNLFTGTEGQQCAVVNTYQFVAIRNARTADRTRLFEIIGKILRHLRSKCDWIAVMGDWNTAFQQQQLGYEQNMEAVDKQFHEWMVINQLARAAKEPRYTWKNKDTGQRA
eukprot:1249516-Rhodomonas_salina.1